jgi:type IV secretory pathway TrbF-like protein
VIIPLSANSYQLRWKEAKFTKEGTLAETARMTGVLAICFKNDALINFL